MGKAKIREKLIGIQKQRIKHIDKFREAFNRGDEGAMNYMARELLDYSKITDKLMRRLLPKKSKRIKNLEKAKNINEFEKIFSSMWKTAKLSGITKKDVAEEIKAYRKENA